MKDYKGNVMSSVRKAKGLIQSGLFDELAFKSRDEIVKMMSGIPSCSTLRVVCYTIRLSTRLSPSREDKPVPFAAQSSFRISIATAS